MKIVTAKIAIVTNALTVIVLTAKINNIILITKQTLKPYVCVFVYFLIIQVLSTTHIHL